MKIVNMVAAGFFLMFIIFLISLPLRNSHIFLAAFFLLGFAAGPVWPMIIGIGASLNQERSGTSTSILYSAGGLGGVLIPVPVGLIAQRFGFYNSFWLLAFLSALGFLLVWFGVRKRLT
jgi:fucose permease